MPSWTVLGPGLRRDERVGGWRDSVLLIILAALVLAPGLAFAAPAPASGEATSSIWTIDGAIVRVRIMVPTQVARKLAAKGAPAPSPATVASAVSQAIGVTTPAGDCEAIDQGEGVGQIYTLALTPGLDRFEIVFACPQATGLVLKDELLFDRDPGHIDYAQIRIGAGQPVLTAFTRNQRAIALPGPGASLRGADAVAFAQAAAMRMVTNIAALAILFGGVLLSRRWRDLAWLSAALAGGYLASAAVALSGVVTLDQSLAGALLGLLAAALGLGALRSGGTGAALSTAWRRVAWVATGLVVAGLVTAAALKSMDAGLATFGIALIGLAAVRTPRLEPRLGALVFAPAAAFAFMDGLGPASDLSLLHPPAARMAPILAGHDLGGLAVAVIVASAAMGLLWLAGLRLRAFRQIGAETAGAALIGLGLFWFVSRLYS
jgi:hypothetical protein